MRLNKLFCIAIILVLCSIAGAANLNNVCEVKTIQYYANDTDDEGEHENCAGTLTTGLVVWSDKEKTYIVTTNVISPTTFFQWTDLKVEGTLIERNDDVGLSLFSIPKLTIKLSHTKFGKPTNKMALVVKDYNIENEVNTYKYSVGVFKCRNSYGDIEISHKVSGGGVLYNENNEVVALITDNNNGKSSGPSGETIKSFLENLGKNPDDICPPAPDEK